MSEAAIASKESAKIYNLDILESNIQDEENNITRFLLMGKSIVQPELKKETLSDIITESISYMEKRFSKNILFHYNISFSKKGK